jgi:hypothetical protein
MIASMLRLLAPALAAVALLTAAPAYAQSAGPDPQAGRMSAELAHRVGVAQYRQGQYDAALRQFEKAVTLAPDVENYRRSLLLTRQRIAINKANDNAMRDSAERTRKAFALPQAGDDDAQQDSDLPLGRTPSGATSSSTRPGAPARRASGPLGGSPLADDPQGMDAELREILNPRDMVRDPVRDLNLGGGIDLPSDLPIAGSGMDLPIGQVPPDRSRTPAVLPDTSETAPTTESAPKDKDDGSLSILHDIDVMQGRIKPDGTPVTAPQGPRLDTSDPLP